mmetsp:Transcript_26552/g.37376  ORF Transcript_26552/g.37376 Transcript_26552/m.37376 type:complete len:297 (-) Transcript_26552:44-934(-)
MTTSNESDYSSLLGIQWNVSQVEDWLKEDVPSFDYGGFVVGNKPEEAILYCKSSGVLAGKPFFTEVFKKVNCTVSWNIPEGSWIDVEQAEGKRVSVATVCGTARNILLGERTALNILARCSGIATRAYTLSKIKATHTFKGVIAGTRKTTPGFRAVEKYGILVGGCDTHRMDLSSMIMLKDNHVWSTGSIANAVKKAKSVGGFSLKIEVECRSFEEAIEAAQAGCDVVMLDNLKPTQLKETAKQIKLLHPHILIEASGGVTVENVHEYFSDDIDVISMGTLTQSVPHVDFSLKVKH